MGDIELAVSRSRRLEQLLEHGFGATGKGLHQKVGSVEHLLPTQLVRQVRLVATVRNKVVHESDGIRDRDQFVSAAEGAERELESIIRAREVAVRRRGRAAWRRRVGIRVAVVVVALLALLAAAYLLHR